MTTQLQADDAEKVAIHAYEIWQGWQQEHALQEIERTLRGEESRQTNGDSAPPSAVVRWALYFLMGALISLGVLIWLRSP